MNLFIQALVALPTILKMLITLIKKLEDQSKEEAVKLKLKEEIKVINEAFKNGDSSKLDKLWNDPK